MTDLLEAPSANKRVDRPPAAPAKKGTGPFCKHADKILSTDSFALDEGRRVYRFERGAYRLNAETWIRARVKTLTQKRNPDSWSRSLAEDVLEYIRVDRQTMWEQPPPHTINLRNGLLRVLDDDGEPIHFDKLTLKPHEPSWLSTVQLPVDFDPGARCPAIETFVEQVFPKDAVNLAWEIPAYLMRPNCDIQKAVLLHGPGGNGKSTWLAMLEAFLGNTNVSSIELHKLEADRFSVARIYGKLANICADLPTAHLAGTSVFKRITGGDRLSGEHKFGQPFEFRTFCRLLFSANEYPRSPDATAAFFDRWVVIPFDRPIRGTDMEVAKGEMESRLGSPRELSGMLNMALKAMPSIHKKASFSSSDSTEETLAEFRATTDPMAVWINRYTIDDPQSFVRADVLLAMYNEYLSGRGRSVVTPKAFGTSLRKLRRNAEFKQRTVAGNRCWCYTGINLSPLHSPNLDQQVTHDAHDAHDSPTY